MDEQLSRRGFLSKAVAAMCTVLVFDFVTVAGAKQITGFRAVSTTAKGMETMPHVIVKMWPGRSEKVKIQLAEAIARDVVEIAEVGEGSVSVAIEEVPASGWKAKVYDPDIKKNQDRLYKKPGYSM